MSEKRPPGCDPTDTNPTESSVPLLGFWYARLPPSYRLALVVHEAGALRQPRNPTADWCSRLEAVQNCTSGVSVRRLSASLSGWAPERTLLWDAVGRALVACLQKNVNIRTQTQARAYGSPALLEKCLFY